MGKILRSGVKVTSLQQRERSLWKPSRDTSKAKRRRRIKKEPTGNGSLKNYDTFIPRAFRERPGFSAWNFIIDTCHIARYNINMIRSFAHKGLKEFFENGSKKGIQPEHAPKLGRMLDRLDASISPQDMNLPGYRLHPLKGDKQDMWFVTVNGNWRLTFYFEGQDAHLVDYQDYH